MALPDLNPNREKIFQNKVVYYSGTIRGVPNADPDFAWNIVQFMIGNGAKVLDPHVAARSKEEMADLFHQTSGIDIGAVQDRSERAKIARKQDLEWVHQASHFIALVTTPSLGVGIEIQETIRKPQLGFNKTPILFLVDKSVVDRDSLSNMVTGIDPVNENVEYEIGIYENLEDIKQIIIEFFSNH